VSVFVRIVLNSISKPKQRRSLSKIIAFHFWKNTLGFKILFKFDFDSIRILKRNYKSLISKLFLFKSIKIQKLEDLNSISNFQNLASVYFHYSLI
jgi:hypothetical protein